ncbi:MAG TPA: ATP-dependent DNA helicase UvrD2 [Dermatophilaceae bacterium]|nr:ATP-dependent DNA helicase UvrD2 [Dermatophilaceae bacterium]
MRVLAGAGTGKTRAITHRIAYGVLAGMYQPSHVLAVTFTARAAGQMRSRLRVLGIESVQARTFHAASLRQLHFFWPRVIGGAAPELVGHKAGLVAEAGSRLRLQLDRAGIRDLSAEIEWAKVNMLTEETYPAAAQAARRAPAGLDPVAVSRLLRTYEDVKTTRGVIDFEDALLVMVGMLAEREDVADQIRRQYRHFVVDEYQDVNPVQQRLLELWLGGRKDLCVVGDPAQTIYSFTGATPRYLLEFPRRHPGADTVQLVRNYRSTPQVVELANTVLAGAAGGVRSGLRLVSQVEAGPSPTFESYPDDDAEASAVARGISRLIAAGVDPAEIAVLFRTNAQSEALESALAAEGVGYQVRGGERFFARREVREALLLLRAAARSDDGTRPLEVLTGDILAGLGWRPDPPAGSGASRDQWESLAALIRLAGDLGATVPLARLPELVAELDQRAAAQHAPTTRAVTLASLHAAKGLEWDAVYLVGCSEGLLPISMADTPEGVEEERRLLYVGMTRARSYLRLSMASLRAPGSRATRRPSRFLDGTSRVLGPGVIAPTRESTARAAGRAAGGFGRPPRRAPTTCRGCGEPLQTAAERKVGRCATCPPTYDTEVFERLRAWRKDVSTAESVPAFVVFTDATLTAVAELMPVSLTALSAVSGVGSAKLARYGADVLAVLAGQPVEAGPG